MSATAFAIGVGVGAGAVYAMLRGRTLRGGALTAWNSSHGEYRVRSAVSSDVGALFRLTYALADVCKELHELIEDEAGMRRALADGMYEALVIETEGRVIGMAIFQMSYRTWSGNSIYLQDLIIAENHRGRGLGTLIFQILSKLALARDCDRLFWESTADNLKARGFYAGPTIGAAHAEELLTWKLIGRDQLAVLASALQ